METFAYTCDSPIVPENHFLYDKIFVRINLTCNLPIKQMYYSLYPLCEVCQERGKNFFTKGKIQMRKKRRI
ncbi:hypothetical protein C1646_766260 [Rhizophagus diaphanus]|nr:hypothetical protein C1646_766260 [Rhizophagus diaphanus] [Rhizophagus sp. MUCL 43196]